MRRFKSVAQAQRFLSVHGVIRNLFTVGRHLFRARHQRLLRTRAFVTWNAVAGAERAPRGSTPRRIGSCAR